MAIPRPLAVEPPLLNLLRDGKTHRLIDLREQLAEHFRLTDEEKEERFPAGTKKFYSVVWWAQSSLKKAKLAEAPEIGTLCITEMGRDHAVVEPKPDPRPAEDVTPEEAIETAYQSQRSTLVADLLESIKKVSPAFFEHLVVNVLQAMGYGGEIDEAGSVVGRPGDGGIDGIIKQDRLGLDVIYIQAKRYADATVDLALPVPRISGLVL